MTVRPFPLGNGSYNGIAWGPGLKLQVVSHDGLEQTPGLRTNDTDRAEGHGTWTAQDWMQGRTLTLEFAILGDDPTDLRTQLAAIEAAWLPDSTDRVLWVYDSNRYLTARVRRRAFDHWLGGRDRVSRMTVQWYARDPRYRGPAQVATVGLVSASGGLTWALAWPLSFGTLSGGAVITNTGPLPAPWTTTIAGPVTNPAITNDTVGATVRVNTVLDTGDVLTLDSEARTVTLNGTVSRDNALDPSSRWWDLQPGQNNIRYSSGSGSPSEYATVTYAPVWP